MSAPPPSASAGPAQRPRRERLDAAARRETILDVAIPMFASAGYDQTRMSDIAARVGVTEPVIFQNFGTKADLFAAALGRASREAGNYLNDVAERSGSVHGWLSHLLAAEHLDHLHTAPMFGVLFADAHRLQLEAGVREALHRSVAHAAGVISGILRRGQAEGSIRDDASPDTLAWLVVSLIQARQFRRMHTAEPASALEHDLLRCILGAVRPQPPLECSQSPA
ncbi:MAG TPA: TetR/AcrR family transcriptional regulator [Chloroflexota bacterium]|nr:TetR/AcrR family transcriptional regulator [Chloroflexota bacterium]